MPVKYNEFWVRYIRGLLYSAQVSKLLREHQSQLIQTCVRKSITASAGLPLGAPGSLFSICGCPII